MPPVCETITRFRCQTCNSIYYNLDDQTLYDEKSILSLHDGCDIAYFTEESFDELSIDDEEFETEDVTATRNSNHSEQWFLKKARIINRIGYDFTRFDFQDDMEPGTFRQWVYRLKKKGAIIQTIDGRVPAYLVTGEKRWEERGDVTLEGMGVGLEFEQILRDTAIQYPKIHDIKLHFPTTQLHKRLQKSRPVAKRNGLIVLPDHMIERYQYAKISVYPTSVVIDIACTKKPLVYDVYGATKLVSTLQTIREKILVYALYDVDDIPSCDDWTVTHYHFNKDSKSYCKKDFEVTVNEMSAGFIRFYSKKFPDGKTRARLEQIRTPKTRLKEEILNMFEAYKFVYGNDHDVLSPFEMSDLLSIKPRSKANGRQYFMDRYFPSKKKANKILEDESEN